MDLLLRSLCFLHFTASNNVGEYEALAHGLKLAKAMGIKRILCYGDSDLVGQQTTGHWDAKDANMAAYRFFVQQLTGYFDICEFHHIPRTNNEVADTLANIGSLRQQIPPGVALEKLYKPSITPCPSSESIRMLEDTERAEPAASSSMPSWPETIDILVIEAAPSWTQPFLAYLANNELLADELSVRQIKRRASAYTIINNELYKKKRIRHLPALRKLICLRRIYNF